MTISDAVLIAIVPGIVTGIFGYLNNRLLVKSHKENTTRLENIKNQNEEIKVKTDVIQEQTNGMQIKLEKAAFIAGVKSEREKEN